MCNKALPGRYRARPSRSPASGKVSIEVVVDFYDTLDSGWALAMQDLNSSFLHVSAIDTCHSVCTEWVSDA